MKILLTGATGFVGRYVAKELLEQNIEFVTVGRNFCEQGQSAHIEADLLSINNFSKIIKKANATHLIHLAWYAEHGKYWTSLLNLDWMQATTKLVTEFCQQGGHHITISGSCAEYDWNYGYCDEELTPANPSTIYGIAKDATRRISQTICKQYDVPIAWGRVFFPYGQGEPITRLIPSLFAVFRNELKPFGVNANSYRDLLHVTDVANAFVKLSQKQATGLINISSGKPTGIKEVVKEIANINNDDAEKIFKLNSERKGEPVLLVGNQYKLAKYGWCASKTLAQGLHDFY